MLDLLAFGFGGPSEWMIIAVIVLVLFGGTKIPELMRGVGKGVGELQKGLEEGKRQLHQSMQTDPTEAEKKAEAAPVTTEPAKPAQ